MQALGDGAVSGSADVTDAGGARRRDPLGCARGGRPPRRRLVRRGLLAPGRRGPARERGRHGDAPRRRRAEAPAARTLVVSTGEVYGGTPDWPLTEEHPFAPLSPYAASKAAAELAAGRAARAEGQDVVVVRPFQHVGPGQEERFAVGSWTRQIARLNRRAAGRSRSATWACSATSRTSATSSAPTGSCSTRPVPAGTYNVASGEARPLADVVEILVGLAQCPVTVRQNPARVRAVDVRILAGDASRLRDATGGRPEIPLEQTLADALEHARTVEGEERAAG